MHGSTSVDSTSQGLYCTVVCIYWKKSLCMWTHAVNLSPAIDTEAREPHLRQCTWSPCLCPWCAVMVPPRWMWNTFLPSPKLLLLEWMCSSVSLTLVVANHLLLLCHSILEDSGNCPQGVSVQRKRQIYCLSSPARLGASWEQGLFCFVCPRLYPRDWAFYNCLIDSRWLRVMGAQEF